MKLTIGITTHDEDIFLEELLYTIYENKKKSKYSNEYEIIITNDNLIDSKTRNILKKYEKVFTIIYLKKNYKSPAYGRNRIITEAKGDYILFMDGDDNFVCLIDEIIEELEKKNKSIDVFVSEVTKIGNEGLQYKSPFIFTKELFNCNSEEFEINKHKLIVHQTGIWSIYKISFLKKNKILYDLHTRYEDNLFNAKIYLTKNVNYGRLNVKYYGWRTNFASFTHKDNKKMIKNRLIMYKNILDIISKCKDNKKNTYLLYAIWNQTYGNLIRCYPNNLSTEERKKYLIELKKISQKYKKTIKEVLKFSEDKISSFYRFKKFGILYNMKYTTLELLTVINKLNKSRNEYIKNTFKIFQYFPMNQNKIFITSQYGKFNDNPKYFYLSLKKDYQNKNQKIVFAVKDKKLSKEQDFINYNNKILFYYHHYTSKRVYFNTWIDPKLSKRKNQIWIQMWHGYPYKKIYKDIPTYYLTTEPRKIKDKELAIEKWDFIWSVNKNNTEIFKKLFNNVEIIEKEYPKTKWLIDNKNNNILKKQIFEKYRLSLKKKYALYAPTYRPYFYEINLNKIIEIVPKNYHLVIHLHPMFKINEKLLKKYKANEKIIFLNKVEDIQEIILIMDELITDYSSITYDFLKIQKPVKYIKEDYEIYEKIQGLYKGEK